MIYSEGNIFVEGLILQFYSIFNASSQLKTFSYPHNLSCYKPNVVLYIGARRISSLCLFIQN